MNQSDMGGSIYEETRQRSARDGVEVEHPGTCRCSDTSSISHEPHCAQLRSGSIDAVMTAKGTRGS